MPQPKIVAIGIGSFSFGVELLRDVFQTDALRGCRLDLVDLDATALRRMTGLAQKLNEASGWQVDICPTTERETALPGADFVVTSIEINRDALWKLDHEICLRHGLGSVLSENGGPGGLSHALRTVPPMVAVARDVERLCPNALLLNYTNPEGRICLAIRRHTSVRAVGLCHGVAGAVFWVASVLGRAPATIDLRAAGTNHFTWMTTLTDAATGEDLYPEFRTRIAERPDDRPLAQMLCKRFGLCPTSSGDSHVGEFIGYAAEIVGTNGYDFDQVAETRKGAIANIEGWASGGKPVAGLLAQPSREERVHMGVTHIIADVITRGSGRRPSFNLPNEGYIENISRDAVVEVPGIVENGRVCGVPVGPLPGPIASMVQNEVEIQKLVVDAAVTGDRDLALAALTLDPVVNSARKAEKLLDDILTSHASYLPQFA